MARILLVVALLAVTVYALADWASRSRTWTPGKVNRWVWLALIVLIPLIGPLAWIITGWVTRAEAARAPAPPQQTPKARPDDDPDTISDLADRISRRQKRTRPERKFDGGAPHPSDPPSNEDEGEGEGDPPNPSPRRDVDS